MYRTVDEDGNTIDFYLSHRRNALAAKWFLKKFIKNDPSCDFSVINSDKNPAYGQAVKELKQNATLSMNIKDLQIQYRND
ncbi:transposase [Legionella busanensis]|uniref:Transposase n=1 Tax=Legionella busanensis TaxID=190655 RepID=A0A378KAL3_9GAMM|nr:DDE-type integrase/transposase/recombinase [Legionella busanensis]STX81213.1 transposase [Legionella busanensis]